MEKERQTDRQAGRQGDRELRQYCGGKRGQMEGVREGGWERGSGKLRERDREISMISDHS